MTSNDDRKRVILYARVSSEEQAKKGYSLSGQIRLLRQHATERDRIARKRGYVFVLEEEFREYSCILRALEDKDEDSAEERLMRAIKDDFAEYEHAKIA